MDRSVTGGGLENEIKQLKTLLGQVAQVHNLKLSRPKNQLGGLEGDHDTCDSMAAKENTVVQKMYE